MTLTLTTLVGGLSAAAPASATGSTASDGFFGEGWYYIQYPVTTNCLVSDWVGVYTATCVGRGYWYIFDLNNGYFQLQAANTKLCLSNFTYTALYPTTCNINSTGQWWYIGSYDGLYYLRNVGTGNYLGSDYSNAAYLSSNVTPWSFY